MIEEVWSDGVLIETIERDDPAEDTPPDPVQVAAEAIRDEISARLAPSSVNTILEVKAAVMDGLDAAVARLST